VADIGKLLWPKSVAVIGASSDTRGLRGRILEIMKGHPFSGPIYPVSRSSTEVQGLKTYPSVGELPGPAELAVLIIPVAGGLAGPPVFCFGQRRRRSGREGEQAMKNTLVLTFDTDILSKNAAYVISTMVDLGATLVRASDGSTITAEDLERAAAAIGAEREAVIRKSRDRRGRVPHRQAGQPGAGKPI